MDIYQLLEVLAIVLGVIAVFGTIGFCIGAWLICRETHIEPIVIDSDMRTREIQKKINAYYKSVVDSCEPKTKKIWDASKEYQNAKVGQVLGARK